MNSGNPLSQSDYKWKKSDAYMEKIIVDEETFIASFGAYHYKMAEKYKAACELNKQIKNSSEIARQLNHSNKTINAWLHGKQTPIAIKSLNSLKAINLMPLKESNSRRFILFTELAAFLFGDGHLMKHLGAFTLFGQRADLEKIKVKLIRLYKIYPKSNYLESNSEITKIMSGEVRKNRPSGGCWRLNANNSSLARLLSLADVPVGDKVSIPTRVPEWVMAANKETKRHFLGVLFGNELQCPYIRAKNAFTSVQLGFHKIESKKEDLRAFLVQIKLLLSEFGISTSSVAEENCRTIRKDGNRSLKLYFAINSHGPNILRLFKEIPFKCAEGKQKRFANAVEKFLKDSQWLEGEWNLYGVVMEMHRNGFGRRTIFKKLQLPKKYFYKINAWIHYSHKPLYYDNKELFCN